MNLKTALTVIAVILIKSDSLFQKTYKIIKIRRNEGVRKKLHSTWIELDELSDLIRNNPTSASLYQQRAVLSLQCGLSAAAYIDSQTVEAFETDNTLNTNNLIRSEIQMNCPLDAINRWLHHYVPEVNNEVAVSSLLSKVVRATKDGINLITSTASINSALFEFNEYMKISGNQPNQYETLLIDALSSLSLHISRSELLSLPTLPMLSRFRRSFRGEQRSIKNANRLLEINPNYKNLELIQTNNRGLSIRTKKSISMGSLIITDTPIVSYFASSETNVCCAYCFRPLQANENPRSCKQCGELYCSESCQQAAYVSHHSQLCGTHFKYIDSWTSECNIDNDRNQTIINSYLCMIVRLLAMTERASEFPKFEIRTPLDLPMISVLRRATDQEFAIISDEDRVTEPQLCEHILFMDEALRRCLGPTLYGAGADRGVDMLAQLTSLLLVNAIGTEEGMNSLLLPVCFMNHDCSPNVNVYSQRKLTGNMAYVVALRDIEANEELTLCYTQSDLSVEKRRLKLLQHYGFDCSCSTCESWKQLNENI